MTVTPTEIPDVKLIRPACHRDARGVFLETYHAERYRAAGIDAHFVQENESRSARGVFRGLHWQAGAFAQAKLVRVARGAVWDVVVDIRRGSPTFGRCVARELTAENAFQLFVPRGFAHGFLSLADETVVAYKCDNLYRPEAERGLRYDDPALALACPALGGSYLLSEKDRRHPCLKEIEPWS